MITNYDDIYIDGAMIASDSGLPQFVNDTHLTCSMINNSIVYQLGSVTTIN